MCLCDSECQVNSSYPGDRLRYQGLGTGEERRGVYPPPFVKYSLNAKWYKRQFVRSLH